MTKIKNIIITGPTGAVGTALINECVKRGIKVTAVVRKNSSRMQNIQVSPMVKLVECNLDELNLLAEKVSADYDAFFHFAWDGTYGDARRDLYRQILNIKYTVDAVNLAKQLNCKVFIGAGSQSEYGHVSGVLKSDSPCNPDNGYGIAKLSACYMSRERCRELNIRHNWCRIVSLFGPYDGSYTLISTLIRSFLNGEDVDTTKGDQVWDYIYSKDAANAFIAVAEKGKEDGVYVFGSGKTRKLSDYIVCVRDMVNPKCKINFGAMSYYPNQVMHLEADISNLTHDTGFVPQYTFEQGLKETVDWAKTVLNLNI